MVPARRAAIGWMLVASMLVTLMGALIKQVGTRIPVTELATLRSLFLLAALLPFMLREGRGVFHPGRPGLLLARALTLVVVNVLGFWVLTQLPLALATSLSFTKPLFIVPFAALFLGERLRLRRSLATLLGFAGVFVMLDPFGHSLDEAGIRAALVALFAAAAMAMGVILVKKLAASDRPNTIIFYGNLTVVLILSGPTLMQWTTPTVPEWAVLCAIGLLGLGAQHGFIRAYRSADASLVAPFEYSRILLSAFLGWLMFGESVASHTIAGAFLVAFATLYIARREHMLARMGRLSPPAPPPPLLPPA